MNVTVRRFHTLPVSRRSRK